MTETTSTAFSLDRVVRPAVQAIPTYVPAAGAGQSVTSYIRLDMNESPFPPSEKVRAALADFSETNRYPDFGATEVRRALAGYTGMPIEQIIAGAGLDDVLNTLFHLAIDPGDEVIISDPTFGVYRSLIALYGATAVNVPLRPDDFSLDADAVLAAVTDRTKIIIVCTPNNPTGNVLDPASVERIAREAPCIVAIDEAYSEFAGQTHLPLVDELENTAVFRTMSKFAGMAGMRVGYGVFPASMMPAVNKVVPAFHNVSAASAAAVAAALDDIETLCANLREIVANRDLLADQLGQIPGVHVFPSATNFLLMRLPVADGPAVQQALAARGILVRDYAKGPLHDCIRVSIGTREENQTFLQALQEILTQQG